MRIATAEWADPALVETQYAYRDGTVWLGRSASKNGVPLGYRDDRHVCLVSGSRGGKGASFIVPALIEWPGSCVTVDCKGENSTVTSARRGRGSKHATGLGQAVRVLDPFKTAIVDDGFRGRFNPLDALDPEHEEVVDEAGRIADAIVVIHEDSKDPFWDESARTLVKALILYILVAPRFEGRRNLLTLRQLVMRGDWEGVETLRSEGDKAEDIPPPHILLWTRISNSTAFGGLLAGMGDAFANMLRHSPKQYESVLQVANRNTEFLDSPGMQRCLESSDFSLSELKTRPEGLSLYLCLPQRFMNTHYRWLRMMIALTVTEMEKVRGRPVSGHPILMVLDEFAGLKRMEVIENAVAQIAGFGVKLLFVLQSLEQLKAVYKDNWETFLANSGLKIFFNLEDHFSREYVSKLVGETEVIREVRSGSETAGESESVSRSVARSESHTRGTNVSTSTSDTSGTSDSVSSGRSGSVSKSTGKSWSWSEGETRKWSPGLIFYKSYEAGASENKGKSENLSSGTSKTDGWSSGDSHGTSRSTSRSRTEGTSESWTTGVTETEGTTRGTNQSRTSGASETIQKRALVTPDEIGFLFSRVDDRTHDAYPGLALAVISGARPVAMRRVNYYEDYQFIKMFDPHPDHPYMAPKELPVEGRSAGLRLSDFGLAIAGWSIRQGQIVPVNYPAVAIAPSNGPAVAHIRTPHAGLVKETGQNGTGGDIPEGALFSLWYYEDGSERVDPFAELRALCDKVRAELAEKARTQDVRHQLPMPVSKPFLRRPAVLAFGGCVLLAIVIAIIANSGRQETTGSNNSYNSPAPIITPEKRSSAERKPSGAANPVDSPRPTVTPEEKSSTESEPPTAPKSVDQPGVQPGPIMIGNVDVSRFAGVRAGDTPAQVATLFGRPTADDGGRKTYLKWLTVDYENGGAKAVHLNASGVNRVYSRLGFVNDDLMLLFFHGGPENAVQRLGEPQQRESGDGGPVLSWTFANARSEPGSLQLKFEGGSKPSVDTISVTW